MKHLRLQDLRQRLRQWAASPAMRLLRLLFVALGLGLMAWSVLAGTRDLQARAATLDLRLAGIGLLFVLVASLLGSAVWWCMLAAFHLPTPWRQSIVIHMTSNVAKYVPGYGWHYVSKGYFLQETAKTEAVFLVIVSELGVVLSSGAFLGLAAMGLYALPVLGREVPAPLAGLLALAVLGGTLGWLVFVQRRLRLGGAAAGSWQGYLRLAVFASLAWLLAGVGWFAFAAATQLFIVALDGASALTYPASLLALTFSSIVSILVIFVPAGLGVREVTMAALLAPAVPVSLGVTVSIMLRLAVIACEFMQLGLVLLWAKHWPDNLKTTLFLEKREQNTPNGLL